VVSPDFSVTYSFQPYHGPGVDSALSENEYQEHFLEVKAAGAWGWQPYHLHVPNVMKSGSLNLLEPSGPHRAGYGTASRLPLIRVKLALTSNGPSNDVFDWINHIPSVARSKGCKKQQWVQMWQWMLIDLSSSHSIN